MNEKIIETKNLTKNYGDFTAVDQLDMTVHEGEIFGFLGPNGAGKSLSIPSSGTAIVGSYNIVDHSREVRKVASILPEYSSVYGNLTASENLNYIGRLNDLSRAEREERIEEMLEIVGMSEWKDSKAETFSRGMKQRVGIAAALIKQPKLVFLDEPTLGLDPVGTREIRELILRLNKEQGLTVILTTHLLPEVQMTCSRVGIINKGRLVVTDTMENLTREMTGSDDRRVEFKLSEMPQSLLRNLDAMEGVKSVSQEGDRLYVYAGAESDYEVSKTIVEHGAVILMMRPKEYTLEEMFMKYYEEG
jgi:ABC-2 type transport system ATP-binding protein